MGKKIALVFMIFFVIGSGVFAQNSEERFSGADKTVSNAVVQKISFSGLKKTKEWYAASFFQDYVGKKAGEINLMEMEGRLHSLFAEYKYSFNQIPDAPDSVSLDFVVAEKISFIPLPFAMYSGGAFMFGGFVMNTNAFGIGDSIIGGGLLNTDFSNVSLIGMYSHASHTAGIPGLMTFLSANKSTIAYSDSDGKKYFEYDGMRLNARISLSNNFLRYNTWTVGFGYAGVLVNEEKTTTGLMESFSRGQVSAGYSFNVPSWNGVFMSKLSLSAGGKLNVYEGGKGSVGLTFEAGYEKPVISVLRAVVGVKGYWGMQNQLFDFEQPSSVGITIMNKDFKSDRLAGLSAGLEWAFCQVSIGTFALYGNYQALFTREPDNSNLFNNGFQLGTRMYMSKVAMPALDISLSYNMNKNEFAFSGSIGASF